MNLSPGTSLIIYVAIECIAAVSLIAFGVHQQKHRFDTQPLVKPSFTNRAEAWLARFPFQRNAWLAAHRRLILLALAPFALWLIVWLILTIPHSIPWLLTIVCAAMLGYSLIAW